MIFLTELWIEFPEIITDESSADIINMLKAIVRTNNRAIKYAIITQMFRLLEIFSSEKKPDAPTLYKALIFILVDGHADDTTRAFIMGNFINFFEVSETIPVGILLDPLIKQFMESEGSTYKYNTFDFEFFISCIKHPKFRINEAIPLMDALAKIYLNDNVFCFAAAVPFMMIVTKYIDTPVLMNYIKKFITLALSLLLSADPALHPPAAESQRSKRRKPLPLPPSRAKKSAQENAKPMTKKAIDWKLKRIAIIEICKKLIPLQNPDLNDIIQSLCVNIIVQLHRNPNKINQGETYDKGLLSILDMLGNAMDMIEEHEEELYQQEQEMLKQNEASEGSRMLEKVEELEDEQEETYQRRGFSRDSRKAKGGESEGLIKNKKQRAGSMNRKMSEGDNMAVVLSSKTKPKNKIELKAFENLEKIRKRREEVKKIADLENEKIRHIEEKRKQKLKNQIEIRRVQLGIKKKKGDENGFNEVTQITKHMSEPDPMASVGFSQNAFGMSNMSKFSKLTGAGKKFLEHYKGGEIELIDYNSEEQRDVDAIKLVAKKYSKLFRYLFSKYANSGYSVKAFKNFEDINKKLQTITAAELIKMLRDHYITNRIIGKNKITDIWRKLHPNSNPLGLTYQMFVDFMLQMSYIIYTGPPHNMIYLSPADSLIKLIKFFEESAKSRGQSTLLYEDPDATSLGDKTMIAELNRRLSVNPNYLLPEGYSKVYEKDFTYEYTIPDYVDISESKRVSLMVLDSLCEQLFDFHFIEPMMNYQEVIKVRPNFKKIVVDAVKNPMAYIKEKLAGKNKLLPIDTTRLTNSRKDLRSIATTDTSVSTKPIVELSTDLKIEVGRFSFEKRPIAQQCAEVLELILQAVVEKRDKIKTPKLALPPSVRINKAGQAKLEQENKEKKEQLKKEQLRKKREKEVREQLKKAKEEIDKQDLERLQQVQDQEKAELAKKQELQQKKQAAKERKKKQLEDLKKAKQEEAEQKLNEEREKEEQKLLEQKKKNKQFLKQQNQKLKEQFELNKKERSEIEKRQAELELKEKEKQQKMKQEMVDFLSKNKDFRKLEEKERQEIHEFYMTEEIQELMTTYDQ